MQQGYTEQRGDSPSRWDVVGLHETLSCYTEWLQFKIMSCLFLEFRPQLTMGS